ncbi:NAD(P)-dependent alcohol dehydrogenase [Gracilibacillus saliphilus]|uniref:NAD(P)-dependent alcohol dehydrogenase n=1 Tax=Gracilibacillus saliphilus TaxID=543890 RepID=UPI0013D69478|nr:NAD(P)-dependent alcohol dehydrogenase [Gracilibacillus saliphilus]
MLKAIMYKKYGSPDVLKLQDINKPKPIDNQVLVRIHAASVNYGNLVVLKGKPFLSRFAFGLFKPKYTIPGGDIAGQVEAVGKNVKQFQSGDKVFGDLEPFGWGGYAEYVAVPEEALVPMPNNISFEEAAAVPMAAVTALQALRDKGNIQSGQKVLIYGASGGVGTFAVQIAKYFGAEVTGVCSTRNIEILRSIGADHIIDYTKEDFTQKTNKYDLIVAVNGYRSIFDYKRALNPNGTYVMVGGKGVQMAQAMVLGPLLSLTGNRKMVSFLQRPNQGDLIFLQELLEEGLIKPVLDRRFKLEEVPDAFRYFEEGHAKGKIVITVS